MTKTAMKRILQSSLLLMMVLSFKSKSTASTKDIIVFETSELHQVYRICTYDLANSEPLCLTDTEFHPSFNPTWSPDGSLIAFNSAHTGFGEIYVMKADGSDLTQLTDLRNPRAIVVPVWSNDSQKIRYVLWEENWQPVMFQMGRDGSENCMLFDNAIFEGIITSNCSTPSEPIVFTLGADIYWIDVSIPIIQKLTYAENGVMYGSAQLSPNGQHIAFLGIDSETTEREYNAKLYIMDWDGANLQYVMDTHLPNPTFGWSPDSTRIAISASVGEHIESINLVNMRDFTIQQITKGDNNDVFGDWSPDGQRIVFSRLSDPFGNWQLFVIDVNDELPRYLTDCGKKECAPDWK